MFRQKKVTEEIHPVQRGFYAWNALHAGSFLVFLERKQNYYEFVLLPGPDEMNLTKETFDKCLKNNMLEYVEQLPEDVYLETVNLFKNKTVAMSTKTREIIENEKH